MNLLSSCVLKYIYMCITLFWLLGTLLGLIMKCNLCFQSKYLGLCCKQFLKINEPNKSWGEMWLPNENGIVCHIFSAFFLEGGGGGELPDFEKNSQHFLSGFCLELTLKATNLLPFDISGLRSHSTLCFEPTTSQEKGHVIITSLVLFIYKHQYSNLFKFAPTSVKLIN